MKTRRSSFATRLILIALSSVCLAAHSQGMSDAEAKQEFIVASANVFEAASLIFGCLSETRKPKGKGTNPSNSLKDAFIALESAATHYTALKNRRKDASLIYEKYNKQARKQISFQNAELSDPGRRPPFIKEVKVIVSEGDVAALNLEAIVELRRVLTDKNEWNYSCKVPTTNVDKFLLFIGLKINLERYSALSEMVWNK
jgi:ribosomal protein L33